MSGAVRPADVPHGAETWAAEHTTWLLVALHVPFAVAGPLFVLPRHESSALLDVCAVLGAIALFALQLRHSLAFAHGERPAAWPVTLGAVVTIAYGGLAIIGWDWSVSQWFVSASVAMLLLGPVRVIAAAAPPLGTAAVASYQLADAGYGSTSNVVLTTYWLVVLGMGSAALYGSARLAEVVDELRAARREMVELAVGRERLRVSRDLHDLLGQSLSAVSLKGDLALRLLATDGEAARAEIESLTDVARGALRDVRAVARDEHAVSLRAEVDAAAALLGAAGIDVRADVDLPALPTGVEQVLAWAVREGATNTLRHSEATTWAVTAAAGDHGVELDMVNDGARGPEGPHRGLDGLAERARELDGGVVAGPLPGGRFRLAVTVPAAVTEEEPA